MSEKIKWVAYVSNDYQEEDHSVISIVASARVLKLLMTLNDNKLPTENGSDSFVLDEYLLGFAQSFQIGDYEIEIVAE